MIGIRFRVWFHRLGIEQCKSCFRLLNLREALGVSESSVRRLADSGEVNIHRTKGGHRKIPIAEAIRYLRENRIQPQKPDILGLAFSSDVKSTDGFCQALIQGKSDHAVAVLQTLYLEGWNTAAIFDGPVLDAMVRIGDQFPNNKKSIFIEHRAVVICMRALMQLRAIMPQVQDDSLKAICAAPAGDPYLLPCLMCSLVFHEAGYSEINLGPNTPLDIVMDAVEDENPRIISLSITSAIRSRTQIAEIEKLDHATKRNNCALIVGGNNADLVDVPGIRRGRSMSDLFALAQSLLG